MRIISIDGKDCITKNSLFETFSEEFPFPDYFSHNWDSFDEVLCDLSWIEDAEIELQLSNYQLILSNEEPEAIDIFYEILSNVEEFSGKQFYVEIIN